MPFATTWMNLEGVVLSEVRQRKTNIIWSHLYVGGILKKKSSEMTQDKLAFVRGGVWEVGKIGEGSQKLQNK